MNACLYRLILLTAVLVGGAVNSFPQLWHFGQNINVGRAGLASTVGRDGTIYVIGGNTIGEPEVVASMEALSPSGQSWVFKSPMPTARTALAVATGLDGRIYAIGGCLESHGFGGVATVEVYDPANDIWQAAAPMHIGRTGHKSITGRDGRIYVIGGYNMSAGHLNSVEIYDPQTDTWVFGSPMSIARQQFGATRGADGRIYVIGGSDQWRSGIMTAVEIYDPITNVWTMGTHMPTARDGIGASVGSGGLIYTMGGWTGNYPYWGDVIDLVEIYDPSRDSWSAGPRLLLPQYGPAAVTDGDCNIYAIAGGDYGVSSVVQRLPAPPTSRTGRRKPCA